MNPFNRTERELKILRDVTGASVNSVSPPEKGEHWHEFHESLSILEDASFLISNQIASGLSFFLDPYSPLLHTQ